MGKTAPMRSRISEAGTTSSLRQPLRLPTSMYSIKRTMCPVPLNRRARSTTPSSFTPRCTTASILMGRSPAASAAAMPCEHVGDAVAASVHRAEDFVVEAVQAHRHAVEARLGQTLGVVGQEVAVGGHGEVVDAGDHGEHRHQPLDVAAHQRLAAGEPDLAHAQAREDAGGAGDLLVGQHLVLGEELVARAEDLGRHAVGTAEVAAVGDRDAQVAEGAPEPVEDAVERPPVFGLSGPLIYFRSPFNFAVAFRSAAIIPKRGLPTCRAARPRILTPQEVAPQRLGPQFGDSRCPLNTATSASPAGTSTALPASTIPPSSGRCPPTSRCTRRCWR